MNIFQKKINKQARVFVKYHNKLWNGLDNISFYTGRIYTKIWNKEDNVNTIKLINEEIKNTKEAILELSMNSN